MTKLIDTPKCLLVEVPDGAANVDLESDRNLLFVMTELWIMLASIQLTPGTYGQPILASEMGQGTRIEELFQLANLLHSNFLQPETTVVIPKTI